MIDRANTGSQQRASSRIARVTILIGCVTSAFAFGVASSRPWSMVFWPLWAYAALLCALAVAFTTGVVALRASVIAPRSVGGALRFWICATVLVGTPWFVWFQPWKALWLLMYAGVASGAVAAVQLALPKLTAVIPPRLSRAVELSLFHPCALLLSAELVLRGIAMFHPSPLFAVGTSVDAVFQRYRKAAGELHLGFPCDARGFNDRLLRAPGSRLVACIGDSFSFGLVPHAFHYTTVAERASTAVEIYNAGVIAAGPAEYLELLNDDILRLRPDAVLIALFVGNDIEESSRFGARWPWLERIFDRAHLMLAQIPRRLATMLREREVRGGAQPVGGIQGEDLAIDDVGEDLAALRARMPWLDDPMLEAATMTDVSFLEVERRRAGFVCDPAVDMSRCFAALEAIVAALGEVPVAFVLIPDEFQVEDALWGAVARPELERDQPQRLVRSWLDARRIPFLDLLLVFRAEAPLADGDRHLYHRNDTHWNLRGNAVTGRALAEFLRGWLPR